MRKPRKYIEDSEEKVIGLKLICPVFDEEKFKNGWSSFVVDEYESELSIIATTIGTEVSHKRWVFKQRLRTWTIPYHMGDDGDDCDLCKKYALQRKKYKKPKEQVLLTLKDLK